MIKIAISTMEINPSAILCFVFKDRKESYKAFIQLKQCLSLFTKYNDLSLFSFLGAQITIPLTPLRVANTGTLVSLNKFLAEACSVNTATAAEIVELNISFYYKI